MTNKTFYNLLADDDDEMISFDTALKKRIELLKKIIKPGMKSAADIGYWF